MKKVLTTVLCVSCVCALAVGAASCTKTAHSGSVNADYVVVGGGAGGLMSALELSSQGKVVLLEKMPALGGTSIRAKGFLWAVDSSINKATGKGLSAEKLLAYYKEKDRSQDFNEKLLKNLIAVSGKTVDQLISYGMPFSNERLIGGTPNYPELVCLTIDGEGPAMIAKFAELLKSKNVEIMFNTRAIDLIVENANVVGVTAENKGKRFTIKAKKTILATGGFTRNESMMKEYNPDFADNVRFSGLGTTGDGIEMALKTGAQLTGNGVLGIWGLNENYGYVGNIGSLVRLTAFYINKDGNRFVNEKRYYAEVHQELNKIQDKTAYGLFDSSRSDINANLEKAVEENLCTKADTIELLAEKLGVDKNNLIQTVEKYNSAYSKGENAEFALKNKQMTPILQAPFYAVPVKPTVIGTIKGLKVNEYAQVVNEAGNPIPNLYAVGELIIGNFVNNEYPTTGTVLSAAVYGAKIASDTINAEK